MITLQVVADDEVQAMRIQWELSAVEEAWRRWVLASCEEWSGGHRWVLELEHPDDGASVGLHCEACPAGVDDVYFDGHDLIWLEVDGIEVRDGKHNSPRAAIIPVDVDVWSSKHWTDYGWDYDAGIDLTPTGPIRYVDGDGEASV